MLRPTARRRDLKRPRLSRSRRPAHPPADFDRPIEPSINATPTHIGADPQLPARQDHKDGKINVLFVCSRNQWRSPTGETLFRKHPGVNVRSAGTSAQAKRRVTANDVIWADLILVMEAKHRAGLTAEFPQAIVGKAIHVLDIPDDYQYMDPELCELLERSVTNLLMYARRTRHDPQIWR